MEKSSNGYEEIEREEVVGQVIVEQVVIEPRIKRTHRCEEVVEQQVIGRPLQRRTHCGKEVIEQPLVRRTHRCEEVFGKEILGEEVVRQIIFAFGPGVIITRRWFILGRQIVGPIQSQEIRAKGAAGSSDGDAPLQAGRAQEPQTGDRDRFVEGTTRRCEGAAAQESGVKEQFLVSGSWLERFLVGATHCCQSERSEEPLLGHGL